RGEARGLRLHRMDVMVVGLWAIESIAFVALNDASRAITMRIGLILDSLAIYFALRCLIVDGRDVQRAICIMSAVAVPVAVAFLFEAASGRNAFAVFGGVPEITLIREGKLRCQGAFAHPILAGCFWASLVPLMGAGLWMGPKVRAWCIPGLIASVV